eukprot:2272715-Pleurochrysis_carterae.AAC.1
MKLGGPIQEDGCVEFEPRAFAPLCLAMLHSQPGCLALELARFPRPGVVEVVLGAFRAPGAATSG